MTAEAKDTQISTATYVPGRMRGSYARPVSQHGVSPAPTHAPVRPASQHGVPSAQLKTSVRPLPKVFNCIVDDTALVAGVKRSTRNGIRQWVKNGQIRLFVPLHALDQLSRQKNNSNRHSEDVRETLQWLDDATTRYPHAVTLQGADEVYEKWTEVETFAVPRALFSENDLTDQFWPELDNDDDHVDSEVAHKHATAEPQSPNSSAFSAATHSLSPVSMRSQLTNHSVPSPPTSPIKPPTSPKKSTKARLTNQLSGNGQVPGKLQPLFNYILWRIHQEVDPVAALESFIFLCNDPTKVNYANGFEIKTKRLEQLREAIIREDRDCKNRQSFLNRGVRPATPPSTLSSVKQVTDDEEILRSPSPPRTPSSINMNASPGISVMDPNAFGRNVAVSGLSPPTKAQYHSQPLQRATLTQPSRGGFISPSAPRGNGRGNFRARGRGKPQARGGFSHENLSLRTNAGPNTPAPIAQIDPDSFSRSRGRGDTSRGGRKLWVPT